MNIKKILLESLKRDFDTIMYANRISKEIYGTGFCTEGNDSFIATVDDKFVMFDSETGEEHDMTDLIETLCDIIEEEIDTRLE